MPPTAQSGSVVVNITSAKSAAASAPPVAAPTQSKPFSFAVSSPKKPAYIPLKTKSKLKESPLAAQSADDASSNSSKPSQKYNVNDLPEGLRRYVTRAMTACPKGKWDEVKSWVHELIVKTLQNGAMDTTDWDKMPLPSAALPEEAPKKTTRAQGNWRSPSPPPSLRTSHSQSKKRKTSPSVTNNLSSPAAKTAKVDSSTSKNSGANGSHSPMDVDRPGSSASATSAMGFVDKKGTAKTKKSRDASPLPQKTLVSKGNPVTSVNASGTPPTWGSDNEDDDAMLMKLPPSLRNAEIARRKARKDRFGGREAEEKRIKQEKEREVKRAQEAFLKAGAEGNPDVLDWDEFTIIGTSTQLEKRYLRLTSAPDPSTVRPVHILRRTLDLLISKWKEEANYTYICDQFKSLRQDLTVQRIKNDLTVAVYETHARIALEKGDLGEYNQCQAQLLQLYKFHNLSGAIDEFTGYRVLYLVHTDNRTELIKLISDLTAAQKEDTATQHALNVRTSVATGDYHRLFRLHNTAPNMSAYLMDHFIDRERIRALKVICRAYRPSIPVAHLAAELGFIHPDDVEEENAAAIIRGRKLCAKWIKSNAGSAAVWVDGKSGGSGSLDTKESVKGFLLLVEKVKSKGVDIKGQIH
ncbi:SAC3/GANP/Nin1/mts3/eIF-3 p25 family-domain-containing protein [Fimicolochytrium jonesii]|uniref:SAC3/GANP/Nin1/mts3/eIF-3 p25 family-domain-containing protein n=1 Tax=Fimicolochytrium jonesii TaxID=1396493 RepID=UPI0022FED8C6|nr:SAC3/GANP/Nin1/mts3/eIF-3 p25 family-domain-containing protein [Fimicolochytrium jonesii]KAI8817556.1 SAC3/GANP/Nin1/mts3/eIF-3 p25 family-domain-containing protein [Fimicolochytrium jonesii]